MVPPEPTSRPKAAEPLRNVEPAIAEQAMGKEVSEQGGDGDAEAEKQESTEVQAGEEVKDSQKLEEQATKPDMAPEVPSDPQEKDQDTHASMDGNKPEVVEEKAPAQTGDGTEALEESKPEIQNIMEQFKSNPSEPTEDELLSPSGSSLPIFQFPKRQSSLENRSPTAETHPTTTATSIKPQVQRQASHRNSIVAPTVAQPPLPEPEPEPALPFDFHRFLEQLRHRTADPVAKFLRSFLQEFGKRQWMVHEQVKIISDFLAFISGRMAQCEVWRTVSDAEFENAKEGMEKLVMNRLYMQTFAPEIPPPEPAKSRRKNAGPAQGPGRRGQHQEDVERDEVLAQKIRIYSWVKEEHLDIKPFDEKGTRLLRIAQQELNKIKSYRAPRDKVICVLNTCKVLFGFLRTSKSEQSADAFIPLLIYTVLKANPEHLVSNVQYILRFRNADKLTGEAGYYMSSLMGAIQFVEQLDKTSLTVSDEEFEKNVEQAVSAIAERRSREERRSSLPFNEKSTPSRPEVTARHSQGGEQISPRRKERAGVSSTISEDEEDEENPAVAGLLRTIQKPFSTLGRIFSDDSPGEHGPASTPRPSGTPRMGSPAPAQIPERPPPPSDVPAGAAAQQAAMQEARKRMAAEESAARQASAETAEAQRVARAEHETVVETLSGMFPGLDKDVISDVVRVKEGRVGLAVDACLALTR